MYKVHDWILIAGENRAMCKDCGKKKKRNYIAVKGWQGFKEMAFENDNHKCRKCGITQGEHLVKYKVRLSVDHINGDTSNNILDNLQTLCLICHTRKDGYRTHPSKLDEVRGQVEKLYFKDGLTLKAVCKTLDINSESLQRAFRRWGLQARRHNGK